jgi:hypothetical protein
MESLCKNSYGCLSHVDGAIGTELDYTGVHTCLRCQTRAIDILQFMIGEPIEWCIDEWVRTSKVQEKLEGMLLYQVLRRDGLV